MIKTIRVSKWSGFPAQLEKLQASIDSQRSRLIPGISAPTLLFRGQADARWSLQSTLERYPKAPSTLKEYWRLMEQVAPQIASLTGKAWRVEHDAYDQWLATPLVDTHLINLPGYDLMVYLRHHGFPSPLLDWTRSPWVAAYFAFRDVLASSKKVAIFAYVDTLTNGRTFVAGQTRIHTMGPFVTTHKRHFLQQCEYTVCASPNPWTFQSYASALAAERHRQDLVWKIELPVSERANALKALESHNLHAYSLYPSDEALMETLAARHIFLGRRI